MKPSDSAIHVTLVLAIPNSDPDSCEELCDKLKKLIEDSEFNLLCDLGYTLEH